MIKYINWKKKYVWVVLRKDSLGDEVHAIYMDEYGARSNLPDRTKYYYQKMNADLVLKVEESPNE